jgi:hypothetical protein
MSPWEASIDFSRSLALDSLVRNLLMLDIIVLKVPCIIENLPFSVILASITELNSV